MGLAAALLEAAARGDAARLASLLTADARDINVTDEVSTSTRGLHRIGTSMMRTSDLLVSACVGLVGWNCLSKCIKNN